MTGHPLFPGSRVERGGTLVGGTRARVERYRVDDRPVIVKQYAGDHVEGYLRERAALSVIPDGVPAPRLIRAVDAPPTIVMSDLADGPSVADALLGTDPDAAVTALTSWATVLAQLHRATADSRATFRAALDTRFPESTLRHDLEYAADTVARHGADLGVTMPDQARADLLGLADRLSGDGPAALTPADACPDNNITTAGGVALIDFEFAQWRHVAWDVAYLMVPWPTCWCAWRLPESAVEEALAAYRKVATVDPRDVAAAVVGWVFQTVHWFLARALEGDVPRAAPAKRSPPSRAMVLHRLDVARRTDAEVPALAEWADRLYRSLSARWGERELAYAPAFRRRT